MNQDLINLYDDSPMTTPTGGGSSRKPQPVGQHGGGQRAMAVLRCNYAQAAIVAESDPRITTQRVSFPGSTGTVGAYFAEPTMAGKRGGSSSFMKTVA